MSSPEIGFPFLSSFLLPKLPPVLEGLTFVARENERTLNPVATGVVAEAEEDGAVPLVWFGAEVISRLDETVSGIATLALATGLHLHAIALLFHLLVPATVLVGAADMADVPPLT